MQNALRNAGKMTDDSIKNILKINPGAAIICTVVIRRSLVVGGPWSVVSRLFTIPAASSNSFPY